MEGQGASRREGSGRRQGLQQQGSGRLLSCTGHIGNSSPPNQTPPSAALVLLKHDGFNLASLYQSRVRAFSLPCLAAPEERASVSVCVVVRWLGCMTQPCCFLVADRNKEKRKKKRRRANTGQGPRPVACLDALLADTPLPSQKRARANFRGCPNHRPDVGGCNRSSNRSSRSSGPPRPNLKVQDRGWPGHGATAPRPRAAAVGQVRYEKLVVVLGGWKRRRRLKRKQTGPLACPGLACFVARRRTKIAPLLQVSEQSSNTQTSEPMGSTASISSTPTPREGERPAGRWTVAMHVMQSV